MQDSYFKFFGANIMTYASFNLLTYVHNLTFIRFARADISSGFFFFVCVCLFLRQTYKQGFKATLKQRHKNR